MSQALHPMLNIAMKAARQAGAIINRAALDLEVLRVGSKGPNDGDGPLSQNMLNESKTTAARIAPGFVTSGRRCGSLLGRGSGTAAAMW